MNLLLRWGAILGVVSTVILGPSPFLNNRMALALPQDQIVRKLLPVPVFTVTDAEGSPLVASDPNREGESSVAGVFISREDAQAFVERLKQEDPQLGADVRVVPVSLAEVYELALQSEQNPENLEFTFVPVQEQVQSALAVLREEDSSVQQFQGVPLFLATGGPDNGYLTIQRGNEQVIPLFFNKEELQGMLSRFQEKQPDLTSSVDIEVVNLEGVIDLLETSDDPQVNKIIFVPPRESIEYLRSLPQTAPGNGANPGQ
jgi:nickel transport protein